MRRKRENTRFGGVVLLALCAAAPSAWGQQAPERRDESATKFEQFLLSKGTVRVREFYDLGSLRGTLGEARFQVARAYTPGKADYILALRVEVKESGRLQRDRAGVLDAEEVASLAKALPQMGKMLEVLRQGQAAYNTEVDFKGGSLRVGFVATRGTVAGRNALFIQAGEISGVTAFFEESDLPKLETLISQAVTKIQELRQKP